MYGMVAWIEKYANAAKETDLMQSDLRRGYIISLYLILQR
jgi:hypothetical protein